ncbi:hypothetical protein GCM10010909_15830 [Acidocella aquatica]|uniref:Uncharacterized protein n=2 Tax=Acidocella aquatica TaxID=1922313 RepID=A0ABQ6A9J7_9PROT|nr:hypothetical protein GCM10010909_15830 [Acidocella aquatica]
MKNAAPSKSLPAWKQFIIEHGWRAIASDLAFILGQPVNAVVTFRQTGVCRKLAQTNSFAALFALWNGREPLEEEWPVPRKYREHRGYEWQPPELALLASMVGSFGTAEIAQILTERLRRITGDPQALRNSQAVQLAMNRIGLQSRDVVGGITTAEVGKEIGSLTIINQAIAKGDLKGMRVGRRWVIPHAVWAAWKAKRIFPPEGFIPLRSLKEPLSIRSDKLSEFARMGHVPSAVRCNPYGSKGPSTRFGTWFIDPVVAEQLIADRHAGRPMPWHGKPLEDNLRTTFKLWQARQHPSGCKTCAEIWGEGGAPKQFEDYAKRYPALAHGAKRHLTMPWSPGLTLDEVAQKAKCDRARVQCAIATGMLDATKHGRIEYVTKTDATRWITRKCPVGAREASWISLPTAEKLYLFSTRQLKQFIAAKKLKTRIGTAGAQRGILYVAKDQCSRLRQSIGFSEQEAARRIGVTVARLRELLNGVNWRKSSAIPLVTVQAVIKRRQSQPGYTFEQAAEILGKPVSWIEARQADGTIRVLQTKWDRSRIYLSEPMMTRLRQFAGPNDDAQLLSADWLRLSDAAFEAGVTTSTIIKWAETGALDRRQSKIGWRYHRDHVRAQARLYWKAIRLHRATPPEWLQAERQIRAGNSSTTDSHANP